MSNALTKRPKRMQMSGKLRAALDAMVWDALEWNEAARMFNFSVQAMRKALTRRHVLVYLRKEREVFRASIAPRNIHRLKQIRDAADNMPAVQAIKVLEQIGEVDPLRRVPDDSPHVTIRIVNAVNAAPAPPTIEHRPPLELKTDDPHDPTRRLREPTFRWPRDE